MDAGDKQGEVQREPDEEAIKECLSKNAPVRIEPEGYKIAAVLVPLLYGNKGWDLLLTRRTQRLKHHKGEISFPGGHREPGDPHLMFTALRETEEEVGISPDQVNVLGRLDDIITITGFRVRPYVGVVPAGVELKADPREIEEVLIFPLREFMEPERLTTKAYDWDGVAYPVHFFHFPENVVWGATARIIVQFLCKCMGFPKPELP
ncbi:MAG: CoA pyrophosphatase [bacterium]